MSDLLAGRAEDERIRRIAAIAVAVAAVVGALSALTDPLRRRLTVLLEVAPVEVAQGAAVSQVFVCTALLVLAWALRRGRWLAWAVTVALLGVSAVLHLLKGIDVEEAVLALAVGGWLAAHRSAFPARPDSRGLRHAAVVLTGGVVLTVGGSVVLVLATGTHGRSGATARATAERLIGDTAMPLAGGPVFIAAGLCLLLVAGWLLVRPARPGRASAAEHAADLAHARRIVEHHGGDTLAYFALREDKSWFFAAGCVIAYAVRDGVCLVSPDPVGPRADVPAAWAAFMDLADRRGWPVTVVGAAEDRLPMYRATGMRPVYLGDEAIVDCTGFTLDGRAMKPLRGSCNRVQRAGYTVRFYDPAALPEELTGQLRGLMTQSRRGETERGFSMTLSRLFDPRDTGLLLAVAHGPDDRPGAFCHWVPAADIGGWSLDVMRRGTGPDLPNGLIDFTVVETINQLRARGDTALGLNFAVMRGVLAGERGGGHLSDLQRRLLRRFADRTQLESLWRYNEKFLPEWRPRFVVFSGLGNAPAQSLAVADAEGVSELPVVGRLLGDRAG